MELNNNWRIARDAGNIGRDKRWFDSVPDSSQPAPVPGVIQQVFPGYHGVAWFWHAFKPAAAPAPHERALLRFGAVDYLAEVWLNGRPVGGHEGGETPFALDVTNALRPGVKNLLAVRVLNPADQPIDGIRVAEIPHSAAKGQYNPGGIVLQVELDFVPAIRIADIFVRPDWQSGVIGASIVVRNDTGRTVSAKLTLAVSPDKAGEILATEEVSGEFVPGETNHELRLIIRQHRLWELSDPFLYRVTATVTAESAGSAHEKSLRCGFRDFRVKDGFFFLNGRRVFLRCAHTGATVPVTRTAPDPNHLARREMLLAKACGFNCVRFLSHVALPEQIDHCDEIGLMVYQESYAAWWERKKTAQFMEPDKVLARYENSLREMVLRDRNHPGIVIWGMLNEERGTPLFRKAVEMLPRMRLLDPTRLILLNSGRWDGDFATGSVSNPDSSEWERLMGREGQPEFMKERFRKVGHEHCHKLGDIHNYPPVPITKELVLFLRTMSDTPKPVNTKPVFVSEGGFGEMMNFVAMLRRYEQAGARPEAEDFAMLRHLPGKLDADLRRFGMQRVFPFPEDMMRASQRLNLRKRRFWFDMLRSNPNVCGSSLTQLFSFTGGGGFWDYWREMIPGMGDMLRDGWAPLRWCLFADPVHGYAGRPIQLEAVLANEDVLKPGRYPVAFRVWGAKGVVWERKLTVQLPKRGKSGLPPLAVPVLKTKVKLDLPAGEYTFAACLESGGWAAGDRMKFRLSDAKALPAPGGAVIAWGIDKRVCAWLERHGIRASAFSRGRPAPGEVILVGNPHKAGVREWREVLHRVRNGAVAIFFEPNAFDSGVWMPHPMRQPVDWLYHREYVAKAHPVMEGLQAPGMLDPYYYGVSNMALLPRRKAEAPDKNDHFGSLLVSRGRIFDQRETPGDVIVASFACGYTNLDPLYASGVVVGAYTLGGGVYILNALNVLSNIDWHPAADRLLLNLVRHARKLAGEARQAKPAKPAAEPGSGLALLPGQAQIRSPQRGAPGILLNPDGTDRIGNWSGAKDAAAWKCHVPRSGKYRVVIEQSCDPQSAGSTYAISLGGIVLEGVVQPVRGWFEYAAVSLGVVSLPSGPLRVELRPLALKDGNVFMDVGKIRLVPEGRAI
ncbi:MAG: glycoside hydrolase family 2 TIM barrel-domain containing protein [Kiritimatiellia bacterium]